MNCVLCTCTAISSKYSWKKVLLNSRFCGNSLDVVVVAWNKKWVSKMQLPGFPQTNAERVTLEVLGLLWLAKERGEEMGVSVVTQFVIHLFWR